MTKQYRRKDGTVEANQFIMNGGDMTLADILKWGNGFIEETEHPTVLRITTPSGPVDCHIGDYIIKRTDEDIYPCGPDEFRELYEEAR